jgi:hypothetical protein
MKFSTTDSKINLKTINVTVNMPKTIIQLATQPASTILREHGNAVTCGDNQTYYFLPFWFKDLGGGQFEMHQLGDLPDELRKAIEAKRQPAINNEEEEEPSSEWSKFADYVGQRLKKPDPWPLVTVCCGTMRWVHALYENGKGGADYCHDCKKVTTLDFITLEQYRKNYYQSKPITQEEFEALWDPTTGPSAKQKAGQ